MSSGLYESDILAWSEQQAELLRRAAAGERVNGLDWPNLIEEIQDVGLAQLHAVESLLRQSLVHLLKILGWPASEAVAHWRAETVGFLADAASRYVASMRQRIDLERLYRKALAQVAADRIDGAPPQPLPPTCAITLDDLLRDEPDVAALVERLRAAGG